VHVRLPRHLLGRWKHGLDRAEVDVHHPRVGTLLDDPGDDVALATPELAEHLLVLGITQPLHDRLPRRGGRDPTEPLGGVVPFPDEVAVLPLLGPDDHVAAGAVELDPGRRLGALVAVIGQQQSLLDGADQQVERYFFFAFEGS
jgi:hypothetical protein